MTEQHTETFTADHAHHCLACGTLRMCVHSARKCDRASHAHRTCARHSSPAVYVCIRCNRPEPRNMVTLLANDEAMCAPCFSSL